jgi:hypothetical protein
MGPFPKSKNYEYILVAVDYVSKWVEAMPCRTTDAKNSKKMFEETIFPRFRVPRMVIVMEELTSLTRTFTITCRSIESITTSLLHTTLRQVAKQKHRTNKSKTFCRRRSTRWGLYGRIDYLMHYGLIEQLIKHHLRCHHIDLSMERPVIYSLS